MPPVRAIDQRPGALLRIEDAGVAQLFGGRDELGSLYEAGELLIGHFRLVDPKRVEHDAMDRRLVGKTLVGPHHELAAGDLDHPAMVDGRRASEQQECEPTAGRRGENVAHFGIIGAGESCHES